MFITCYLHISITSFKQNVFVLCDFLLASLRARALIYSYLIYSYLIYSILFYSVRLTLGNYKPNVRKCRFCDDFKQVFFRFYSGLFRFHVGCVPISFRLYVGYVSVLSV